MAFIETKEIDEILNKFLEPYELTAEIAPDFAYWYSENKVNYSLLCPERDNRLFRDFAYSLGLKYNVDTFLISLLHEVGHAETLDFMEDEDIYYSEDVKAALEGRDLTDNEINVYFSLPVEVVATQWAVDFINENAEMLAQWWNETMQPAIINFFNRYSINYKEA